MLRFSRARKQTTAMCAPIAIIMPFADLKQGRSRQEKIEKNVALKMRKKSTE